MPLRAQSGGALNFDGVNDFVSFPLGGVTSASGTIELWANTNADGSTKMYIDLYQEQFTIYSVGNSLRARIAGTDLSASFTPNQWNHFALTWSGNGTTARLYLNGVQVATGTQGNTPLNSTTGYLSRSQSFEGYFVTGAIDEVRIWSVARSAAQIAGNYQCEIAANTSGLENYYKFSQGIAGGNNAGVNTLTDATSNGRHGGLGYFGLTGNTSNWVAGASLNNAVTPSVSIAASPSGSVLYGTSVSFTATPTNGGTTPSYQWKKNGTNVGTNSATYTDAALNNGDVITCVLTSNATCVTSTTATSNSLTMAVNYPAGAGLHFDGTNDYIEVPHSASLNSYLNTGELTVQYWIKPVFPASGLATIIAKRTSGNTSGFVFEMQTNGVTRHYVATPSGWAFVDANYTNNTWQHVTVTAQANNTLKIYINGVLVSSAPITSFVSSTNAMRLMANTAGLNQFTQGAIDEVRVWNRALPLCEIQNSVNCELSSGQTGLQAYYKFNQGSGFTNNTGITTLADSSGNNNTGTLTNFALTGTTSNWVSAGGVTSGSACTPYVAPSVTIAGSPSGTITYGTSVTFTATPANNSATPTYQWKKNGVNVGTNSTTYADAALNHNDVISCVLTNSCGATATSNSISAAVNTAITSSTTPVCGTNNGAINLSFAGNLSRVRYVRLKQNQVLDINLAEVRVIEALTGINRALNRPVSANSLFYNGDHAPSFLVDGNITNFATGGGPSINEYFEIDLGAEYLIDNIQIINRLDCCQDRAANLLLILKNGTGTVIHSRQINAYQNQNTNFLTNWNVVDASWSDNAQTANRTGLAAGTYTFSYADETGVSQTLPVVVASNNVTPSVSVATNTGNTTICTGTSVTFTATPANGGTSPLYQWKKNGSNISGATSATYTAANLAHNDTITCTLTSNATCASPTTVSSANVIMTVNPILTPSVSIAATATAITEGTSVTFTATPTHGGTSPQYQWRKNGTDISGATSATYTTTSLANNDVISCILTSNVACASTPTATSNSITMGVTSAVTAYALHFDGVNDYVAAPSGVYFNGNLTIEAWIYPRSYAAWSRVIDFGNGPNSNNVLLTITDGNAGPPQFHVGNQYTQANRKLVLNTWNHIAVTLSGTTVSYYINGVAAGKANLRTPPANVVRNSNYIGRSNWEGNAYANANMDEIRIWNRALTQCEIQNNMGGELSSGQTGLLAYYQFNQGSANGNNTAITTLTDASGNNRTATLTNFALTGTSSNWIAPGGIPAGTTSPTYVTPSVSVNSLTACIGTTATLTATPTGLAANTAYQWESSTNNTSWTNIAGATGLTYAPTTNAVGTRYFRVKATDVCGVVYSAGQIFTVTNPNLTVSTTANAVCQNTSVTLSAVTASGTPTYQWQISTDRTVWTSIAGATTAVFTPTTATVGVTYYRVIGTYNSGCVLTSPDQSITVTEQPTVSITGGNTTVGVGNTTTTLTGVINTSFTATFQWQSSSDGSTGWTDIANSNTLVYQPSAAIAGTLHYRLKVTFANTSTLCNAIIYSNSRRITVESAPVVTVSSSAGAITNSTIYCAGSDVTFSSSCSNPATTPYWTGPNGFTASTANITLSNLTAAHEGVYQVSYVTETGFSGVQSITVKVSPELAVVKTVSAQDIIAGNSARITVAGAYKKGILGKIDFGSNKVLTASALTEGSAPVYAANSETDDQLWWFIPVSGNTLDLSPSVSQRFYIQSVRSGLYLRSNPNNAAVVELGTFSPGSHMIWYRQAGSGKDLVNRTKERYNQLINGTGNKLDNEGIQLKNSYYVTTADNNINQRTPPMTLSWENNSTSTIRMVAPTTTTNYVATFTTPTGCSVKDTTTIRVYSTPTVSAVPTANSVCENQSLSISAVVMGNVGTATYQWQSSSNNTAWTNITGATNSTYAVPTATVGSTYYRVVVTNTLGSFTANGVALAVTPAPIAAVSASQTVACLNASVTLTANYSSGYGIPSVQWQSSPDSSTWANISGAVGNTYQAPTNTNSRIYYRYTVGLSESCLPVIQSPGIAIAVNATLTAQISGTPIQTVCKGGYRVFTLTTNGANPTYSWQSSSNGTDWTTIADATSAHFVAPTTAVGTVFYRGIVTSDCNAVSEVRQISVTNVPAVTIGSPVAATCVDRAVPFTVSGNSGFIKTCIWETSSDNLNWTRQPGVGKLSFTPNASRLGTTYVRVGVKYQGCTDSSYSVSKSLTVVSTPTVVLPATLSACNNSTLLIEPSLPTGVGTQTYQWESRTAGRTRTIVWQTIANATSPNLPVVMNSQADDKWIYRLKVNYGSYCPENYSTEVTVNRVQPPSVSVTAASGTAICQGSEVVLNGNIIANAAYQWQSSPNGSTWTDISGATSASYTFNATNLGAMQYRLSARIDFCDAVNSAPVTVNVSANTNPTLALSANNGTLCGPTDVTITATPGSIGGATPQYAWRRNGKAFVGQPSTFITKTTADGLGSNTINDIVAVGKRVYVATDNGLSVSTDGGMTFTNKTTANGLPSNNITALGVHPNGMHLVIGTDQGPIASNNGGESFVQSNISDLSNTPITAPVTSIGVAPDNNKLYISFANNQIFQDGFNTSRTIDFRCNTTAANSITFKNSSELYLWTNNGLTNAKQGKPIGPLQTSGSAVPVLPYKRAVSKGDTIYTINSRTGFGFLTGNVFNTATGLPSSGLEDVIVNNNTVYVTASTGLFMSKDGGKTFSDITPNTNLGANAGLKRIVLADNNIFIASQNGLRISPTDVPSLTFSTDKSDVIECVMTTTNGFCTNVTKQSISLNYIADVDPLSIRVSVDGTTGTATWGAVNGAAGYGWELMKFSPDRSSKTFVRNGSTANNTVTLTDLNPSSNYELTVKTLCNLSPTTNFSRLSNATGAGSGGSTSFTTGFIVPQVIKDALVKATSVCGDEDLVLGPGFPVDYQVNIYTGTDKTYVDYASAAHPFIVRLTANTKYFYKVVRLDTKVHNFTASNNDPGTDYKRYTVPTGVTKIVFQVAGSKGGGVLGGNGGVTIGSLTPTTGTTYYFFPGTTTSADAGLSRGTDKSANGGGGSYVSTTPLRSGAFIVGGGGGGGSSNQPGGTGGRIGGDGATSVTGGTATAGGVSGPNRTGSTSPTHPINILISQIVQSGFMKGSGTHNITSTWRKADYGGGGGYYGGGSYTDISIARYAGGGGGSSFANTAMVSEVRYEDGTNNGAGYVNVTEYYQALGNSDFLPLDITVMPVPSLSNASITLNPTTLTRGRNYTATMNLSGNAGFETSFDWRPVTLDNKQTITAVTTNFYAHITSWNMSVAATVKYCLNKTKTISTSITYNLTPFQGSTDTGAVLSGANLMLNANIDVTASKTNICQGEQVVFTAAASGIADSGLFYIWRKNGEILHDAVTEVLQTSTLANSDVITCQLFYPTGGGEMDSVLSAPIVMTVATPAIPSVTIEASTNNVCPATPITFTPTPTAGGTTPQYRWYWNGDYVQTSPTYTSSSFANNDYVSCIMESNATCLSQLESELSPSISIQLKESVTPVATVFVLDSLICAGGPAHLTVQTVDAGTSPQYQWKHNGALVGNNKDYKPLSVTSNDAIWCEVTPSADACANASSVQSNTELIQTASPGDVFTPVAIITMNKDSICGNDSLTFDVTGHYLGSEPHFIWQKNGVTFDSLEASVTLATVANGDIITCLATSSLVCATTPNTTSNALTVKTYAANTPTVTISTPNTVICPNEYVVISATPTHGGLMPQYNWRLNNSAYNALPHEFVTYTTDEGLVDDYAQAVFVRNDTAYVATAGGLAFSVAGDSLVSKTIDDGLLSSNVQAIFADDNGVYVGTDKGLSISTDKLSSFRPINTTLVGLSSENITAISASGSTLFVGTDNGLNISTDGGTSFTTKNTNHGLGANRINHLFVDGSTLYVSTEGGLSISTDNGLSFTTKTIVDSLNSDTVLGVWAKNATIYAATQQGIAASTNGGTTFTKLTVENGLAHPQVNGVWVIADSMVYAATTGGLSVSKNGGASFRTFGDADSLGSNTVLGVTVGNGRIYAATIGGFSVSDMSKIRVYPNNGDVFSTHLASNETGCLSSTIAVSNNITFSVATVDASSLTATFIGNTTATLTWTGTPSSYNWRVVESGAGLDGAIVANGNNTLTGLASLSGLTPLTSYDVFVQGACNPNGTVDWIGPLTFTTKNDVFISPKTVLQGAYNAGTGLMSDNLRSLGLVPTTEPYSDLAGFTHVGGGAEKIPTSVLSVTGNDAIVDWVFVELRDKNTPATVVATRAALIQRDGDVVDIDGTSPVGFAVTADDYYVAIRHRNHLGVRSTATVTLNNVSTTSYDFTTDAAQALDGVQKDLTGGKFGMYGGNVNGNNTVRASGSLTVNDYLRLINMLGTSSNILSNVYSLGDVNLDGTVRASGSLTVNDYLRIINAIGNSAAIIVQPF